MKKLDIMRNRDQAIASENALKVEEKKIDVEEIRNQICSVGGFLY